MRNAPLSLKLIINFVAYIGYTLLLSIIFSFSFPFVLNMLGKELYNPSDPIFTKIQVSIAVVVFVITILFRKYFYISFSKDDYINEKTKKVEEKKEIETDWLNFDNKVIEPKVEKTVKKDAEYVFKMDDYEEDEDDNLKIFVDKEIKR
ncbi:hypothetical protein EOM39_02210 [Candidatus Gracilibacteria bacterium]|nr:hypothetical protein [Candidatus Gracilibacteria bacterium]